MAKYFKNVKSFEELKEQFKKLARQNHPDAGGSVEIMQEINCEYDALFPIWKDRHDAVVPGETTKETAESTRRQFYTENGWEGENHDWDRSLKEVAQIVRAYVKEKYPAYRFSVRTSYASMCKELHVELKESPVEIYKTYDELTDPDKESLRRRMEYNFRFSMDGWSDTEQKKEFERIWSEHGDFYKCLNETTQKVIKDVDGFVNSYNYRDCDGMIDYFHVDFYYFGCARNNGRNIKVVPRDAKVKKEKPEAAGEKKTVPKKRKALSR